MTLDEKALGAAQEAWIEADPVSRFFDARDDVVLRAAITAYLQALRHGSTGEAEWWVLVPKEPTWGMQIAGRDVMLTEDDELYLSTDDARACYRAMLAAVRGRDE